MLQFLVQFPAQENRKAHTNPDLYAHQKESSKKLVKCSKFLFSHMLHQMCGFGLLSKLYTFTFMRLPQLFFLRYYIYFINRAERAQTDPNSSTAIHWLRRLLRITFFSPFLSRCFSKKASSDERALLRKEWNGRARWDVKQFGRREKIQHTKKSCEKNTMLESTRMRSIFLFRFPYERRRRNLSENASCKHIRTSGGGCFYAQSSMCIVLRQAQERYRVLPELSVSERKSRQISAVKVMIHQLQMYRISSLSPNNIL